MLWHIVFHCVTIYWLASEYSTSFEKYTMGTDKRERETSCLVIHEGGGKKRKIKKDDQFSFLSI